MITNAENSRPNEPPTGCLVSIFTVRINSKQWSNYQKVFRGPYGERGARAYNGGLGSSPQRGPGAEPLVRVSGGVCM